MLSQKLARHRITISRGFFLGVVSIVLIAQPILAREPLVLQSMKAIGFMAVVIASLGRLWCSLYLCGYKNQSIIDTGPFSVVRNPLYLFSLIGATGIGLSTGTLLVPALMVIFFALLYPAVVHDEETNLGRLLGDSYLTYCSTTPRLVPRFDRFIYEPQYTIHMKSVHAAFKDVIWFYVAWALAQWVPTLHISGSLPQLISIY